MRFKWHSVARNVKIRGVHFLYNVNIEQDKNICEHIVKIENILRLWRS